MIEVDKPNPFQVLRLPINATNKEIVERGQELYDTAETDEERQLYRWAKEQLLTNMRTRLEYALFELPDTQYENPEWETFIRKYQKNPVPPNALMEEAPPNFLAAFDVPALLQMLLEDIFTVPEPDINAAINGSPFLPRIRPPLEVRDVIFG
jgi:hypothetical protein